LDGLSENNGHLESEKQERKSKSLKRKRTQKPGLHIWLFINGGQKAEPGKQGDRIIKAWGQTKNIHSRVKANNSRRWNGGRRPQHHRPGHQLLL